MLITLAELATKNQYEKITINTDFERYCIFWLTFCRFEDLNTVNLEWVMLNK